MKRFCTLLLIILPALLWGCNGADTATPNNAPLILATTTSTQDSGLLDELVPLFQEESGYTVQTVAVGTGAALKMAEEGNADVLLVHAPPAEKALMDAGFGKDRLLVMHNDFVIVGPSPTRPRLGVGMRQRRRSAELLPPKHRLFHAATTLAPTKKSWQFGKRLPPTPTLLNQIGTSNLGRAWARRSLLPLKSRLIR